MFGFVSDIPRILPYKLEEGWGRFIMAGGSIFNLQMENVGDKSFLGESDK